jgi:hypothetical protein
MIADDSAHIAQNIVRDHEETQGCGRGGREQRWFPQVWRPPGGRFRAWALWLHAT